MGRRAGTGAGLAAALGLALLLQPPGLAAGSLDASPFPSGVAPAVWPSLPALGSLAAPDPVPAPASAFEVRGPERRGPDRTMVRYGPNLARGFVGVVSPRNHGLFLFAAAAASAAHALDGPAVAYLERHPRRGIGQAGRVLGGAVAVGSLTVGLFGAGRLSGDDRFRASTYDLSQAVVVNLAWTSALKLAARRQRPNGSDDLSFPSGHASSAFAVATVLAHHHPRLALPGYGLASFVALSRMADEAHHLSDVVAGASLGIGVARSVVRRGGRPAEAWPGPSREAVPRPLGEPRPRAGGSLSVQPDAGPSGDGLGLAVSFAF